MSFFHLRTLPGYAWPALPDAALAQVWAAYQELDRTQWLDLAQIERQQLQQVRSLLAHCITNVPYYRQLLPAAGIYPGAIQTLEDFRRIPLLSRQTYQEQQGAFAALSLPAGTIATGKASTSGTSCRPVPVLQTNMVNLWWCACYLRDLEWCAVDPTGTLAAIRATGKTGAELERLMQGFFTPAWLPQLAGLIETGPAHGMEILQDHRRQLQWLRRLAPDYLLTYPSNLEVLASLLGEEGGIPNLRAIQAISDSLSDESRARIEAAFGVPVKNTYSCTEAGYLASPCPQGHGLHVHAENVLVEVLNKSDRPCQPMQTGRVVLTTLHNFRGPLLRYELYDEATVGPCPCPCGRGLPLLRAVHGKVRPMFRLADGRLKSSYGLSYNIKDLGGYHQYQLIQKAVDHLVIRLVIDTSWSKEHAGRVRRLAQDFFEAPIRVDVIIEDHLEPPSSGKFQYVVCEVSGEW